MAFEITRILSDVHFGAPASRVRSLAHLRPLFAGAGRIVFNGDSLETRPGPAWGRRQELQQRFLEFVRAEAPNVLLVTGNHDPDISKIHHLDLLGGIVFVIHGEAFFDDLVPWSAELPQIRECFHRELSGLSPAARETFETRLAAVKRACIAVRLPHDLPRNHRWDRTMHEARKFWPPSRALAMMKAWHDLPDRAADFTLRHRPAARFVVTGHTHLPGVWYRGDLVIINTGSFCPPFASYAVDLTPERLTVRRVRQNADGFGLGRVVASFALAPTSDGAEQSSDSAAEWIPAV